MQGAGISRARWHAPLLVVLALAGVAGLAVGGFALHAELTRRATAAEAAAAGRAENATRWQRLQPPAVPGPYPVRHRWAAAEHRAPGGHRARHVLRGRAGSGRGGHLPCARLPHRAAGHLRRRLRVAGGDRRRRGAAQRRRRAERRVRPDHLVRAPRGPGGELSGTRAAGYGDAQRGWFHATASAAPYAFLYAAGFADGRRGTGDLTSAPQQLGAGVLSWVTSVLTANGPPCARPDIRC